MSGPVGDSNQEVELNLAPIIDCFTVLITYLLVTASFITLAALDVGVSATGSAPSTLAADGPPPLIGTLHIGSNSVVKIQVRGGADNVNFEVTVNNFKSDENPNALASSPEFEKKLNEIKARFPVLTDISVGADPEVLYKDIVNTINRIQAVLPKVFISG